MVEKKRPNVVGKGPALTREILAIFNDIQANAGSISNDAADKINAVLGAKGQELEKITKMAYLKTVKAGQVIWDMKEASLDVKQAVDAGDEAKAMAIVEQMEPELDNFIHKTKTFVVRMT
jgi:hypothetical protein